MFAGLTASANPRDWMLAAQWNLASGDISPEQRRALRDLAATAAPDDELVQWLVALAPGGDRTRLLAVAGDNASVWLLDLGDALKAGDEAGADAALEHMARATRDTLHWHDFAQVWEEALRRVTPPPADFGWNGKDADRDPAIMSLNMVLASVLPPFQHVMHACTLDQHPAAAPNRRDRCVAIGTRLLSQSDTLIGRRIGYAVLNKVDAVDDAAQQASHSLDWLIDRSRELDAAQAPSPARDAEDFKKDWDGVDNEVDAMRRHLARYGIPLSPPVGWVSARESRAAEESAH